MNETSKKALFETTPINQALLKMCIPTIISQLIILIYNIADTWYIGQPNQSYTPYMVAASSLVLTVFLVTTSIANLFGVGGGSLMVRLMGVHDENEATRVGTLSLIMAFLAALTFSVLCFVFMNPLLRLLGASDQTIIYARQYLTFVVVIGGVPTVLSNTMNAIMRNVGFSKEAGFGLSMGGLLNVALDPLFMFVILPQGYEIMGAAIATMISNTVAMLYFIYMFHHLNSPLLKISFKPVKIRSNSMKSIFAVGVPAALSLFLFDLTNIVINKLSSTHSDFALAAIGIVLKVERLPLNIGIGICLGMLPLVAYNYASGNHERMFAFFKRARLAGLIVSLISVALYFTFAPAIITLFIRNKETVAYGTQFLRSRCFATPFMFLSFHMVHFMQAIERGSISFILAVIRQLCLNIPMLFIFNALFGMTGVVMTQATADFFNVIASYLIYHRIIKTL